MTEKLSLKIQMNKTKSHLYPILHHFLSFLSKHDDEKGESFILFSNLYERPQSFIFFLPCKPNGGLTWAVLKVNPIHTLKFLDHFLWLKYDT